jgi:hypothetical protein
LGHTRCDEDICRVLSFLFHGSASEAKVRYRRVSEDGTARIEEPLYARASYRAKLWIGADGFEVLLLEGKRIRLIEPVVGSEEEKLIGEVLRSGWLTEGPMAKRFEDLFRAFVGAKHAITASSCTTAIEMGLRAMGIGPGDEVLVPDFTHPATADAVIAFGAHPVLVDVSLSSYNLDFNEAEKAVTEKTRAGSLQYSFD